MFKRNLTYLSLINVYVKVTSLAIVPFIARRFTIEEFGVLAMAQTLLGYALDGFDGGIKKIGIRELSREGEGRFSSIANSIFTIRIALLLAAFAFMNVLGALLFQDPHQQLIVSIISFSILAYVADFTWITDAQQNMRLSSVSKFIERTVYLAITVAGIHWMNLNLVAISFPVAAAVAVAIVWFMLMDIKIAVKPALFRLDYLREGLIIGLTGIAASLCLTIDQFMIKIFLNTHELGLYSAATKLYFVVLTFLWVYAYALFPRLSAGAGNTEETSSLLRRHTMFLGMAGTLTVAALCLLAEPLIRLFFSEKFLVILPVFKALNIFLILVFFNVLYADSLNAFDRQRRKFLIIVQALVLNVVLNIFLIPAWGLLGAVYASATAQVWILALSYREIRKMYQPRSGLYILCILIFNLLIVTSSRF